MREKELDEWEAVALSERVKKAVKPAKSKRRFFYNAEVERQKDLVRAEIEKRGESVVLAEMEAAAREIAAEIFANPSARDWIDGRGGPSVWARAINEARRRVATTGSAAKPKPAFDLPPLDLPPLSAPRLSGSPRQISWAEDLRRRAVRDLTEERANETIAPRDHVQRWRQWSTRRDAKKIRETLPELEKAIAEVGGDEAAALILGRETFLKAREFVEAWDDSRDWIDLKTEQKIDLNAYAAQKIAGTPKEAAAILRRYAADAKKTQSDASAERNAPDVPKRFRKLFAAFESNEYRELLENAPTLGLASSSEFKKAFAPFDALFQKIEKAIKEERADNSPFGRFILEADQDDARAALLSRKNDVARRLLGFDVPENTANRQFLRNRAGGAFWDIGEKYGANFRNNASQGLDFTARVLDNIGVDAKEIFSTPQRLRFSSTLDERGSYRGGLVILPKSTTSIGGAVAHEIGHALEEWLGLKDGDKESKTRIAAQELLKKYTTQNGRRTTVFPLCERYPGKGFRPNEIAWEPKRQGLVPDEYILKIYETGETEIVSKWFEYLYKTPYQLTCQYPEFYDDVKEFLK